MGTGNFQLILEQCPSLARDGISEVLVEPVALEEMKQTTFQLNVAKALGPDGMNSQF